MVGRTVAALLATAAVTVALWQVSVSAGGDGRSCGSVLDVAGDRVDWSVWWQQDQADPAADPLLRTRRCPGAVNQRSALAAVLAFGAVVALAAGEWRRPPDAGRAHDPQRQLRRLGDVATALGAALTVAGLLGTALVLADRSSPLYLYVERPVVAVLAGVALVPAVVLVVLGLALRLVARASEHPDAPPS